MPEISRKEFAILRLIGQRDSPVGAAVIARELKAQGIDLTERAVRYHLQALDAAGLTVSRGRAGRQLTEAGKLELTNARVADKAALALARIETLAYQTTFDLREGRGTVAINLSLFRQADFDQAMRVMRPVLLSRFATSDLVGLFAPGQRVADQVIPRGMVGLGTVCSITVNGILLKHGIPVHSEFGGLLEIAGHEPVRFTDIITYRGASVDPVDVFIRAHQTSVAQAVSTGRGKVGASFRTCPSAARDHVMRLVDEMAAWRLKGVIAIGAGSQPLMEMEVDVGRMAFVVCAGLNPMAAAQEAGITAINNAIAGVVEYRMLQPV